MVYGGDVRCTVRDKLYWVGRWNPKRAIHKGGFRSHVIIKREFRSDILIYVCIVNIFPFKGMGFGVVCTVSANMYAMCVCPPFVAD